MFKPYTVYLLTILLSISTITSQTARAQDLYNETADKIMKKVSDLQKTLAAISQDPDFSIEKLSDKHQRLLKSAQQTLAQDYLETIPSHIQDQDRQFEILRLNRSTQPNNQDPIPGPTKNLTRLLDLSNEIQGSLSEEGSHLSETGVIIGFGGRNPDSQLEDPNKAFMETAKALTDLYDIQQILGSNDHGLSVLSQKENPLKNQVRHLDSYIQSVQASM